MYNHIIRVYDELWDIIDDGVDFPVDVEGMVVDKKGLTETHRKIYVKHHKVRGILVEFLLIQIIPRLLKNLMLKPYLSLYAQHMKEISK
jgi:hypothetical protein